MTYNTNKQIRTIYLILNLAIMTSSAAASSDKNPFNNEETELGFKTAFSVPIRFNTDLGELTLTISNSPGEEDKGYMRLHLLSKPETFLEMSHLHFLSRIEQAYMVSHYKRARIDKSDDELGEGEEVPDDEIMGDSKPLQSASAPVLQDACPYAKTTQSSVSVALMENPVYPLKYQVSNYWAIDKYALPKSVLTLHWVYNFNAFPEPTVELTKFKDPAQFYSYVQNRLLEVVKEQKSAMDKKRFEDEIRPLMYL